MSDQDTIAAIATPPGTGGIGIIRLSGPAAVEIAKQLSHSSPKPGRFRFCHFYDSLDRIIDNGLMLYFQAPHSFTGEDIIEIQGHGGQVLQEMLLGRVCELGARLATAGEYTQRAFVNDKIDLTQAEAIADLIDSGSQAAARAAMRSLQGVFSQRVHDLVGQVVELRSFIEAALDFADEEIDFLAEDDLRQRLQAVIDCNQEILEQAQQGQVLREGMTLAIAGLPNAGKSSLLNHLAGYDAAIVTPVEGTTRDVIREHIALKGVPVRVIDTAGLRESSDPVEQEGIRRAWREIERADVVLLLIDASRPNYDHPAGIEQRLRQMAVKRVYTKSDLLSDPQRTAIGELLISTVSGEGIEALIDELTSDFEDFDHNESSFIARRRHVEALKQCRQHLSNALNVLRETSSGELVAEDLRYAQRHLNEITGQFTTEDLLGRIFSSFCIGK